ncbi:aspartate/glutamate racemase family protein [Limimaricola soesokkakensis]|uniref:aspartate/glutamate racemase family protein n=1 Tax=Limimaricola soesokkakensis TaxID=1343159 RepID=UPI003515A600
MSFALIDPNSTASMTGAALAAARRAAPGARFEGWTSRDGPTVIEGPEYGAACIPPLLKLVDRASELEAEAIIIACFDDTGLREARARATCPVIGIGQAAFHAAALIVDRAMVLTTVSAAVPVIEANTRAAGLSHVVGTVRASGIRVADLERDPEAAIPVLKSGIGHAVTEGAGAVILGCAGMVGVIGPLRRLSQIPLIDCVAAAARLAQACVPIATVREVPQMAEGDFNQ